MTVASSSGPAILIPADVAGYNYILQNLWSSTARIIRSPGARFGRDHGLWYARHLL